MSRVSVGWVSGACAAVAMVAAVAPVMRAQAPVPAAAAPADLARGAYLVEEVAQCGRCHSPVDSAGERDQMRWLAGGALDVAPTVAKENWAMTAPRLAGNPPGTAEQFITLMTTGISRNGRPMRRPMPQFHMTRTDAEAVLAYLKSLDGRERKTR
ncbi:MAG: c-type cytochrome [Vicinamibacterales bacterium]